MKLETPTLPQKFAMLQQRLNAACLRASRSVDSVLLIGVTKKQNINKLRSAIEAGLTDFGENYVQEWKSKRDALLRENPDLAPKIKWHFIGHLQSNKATDIVGKVEYIHTVDSLRLAEKISREAQRQNLIQKALFEINLSGEKTKFGFSPEEFRQRLRDLAQLPNISWEGLMTMPPFLDSPEEVRPYFRSLKSLLDECKAAELTDHPMQELSMGMSHDFEVAIEEGATMIRIGTALFGART